MCNYVLKRLYTVFYICSTFQLRVATFSMLSSHTWLVTSTVNKFRYKALTPISVFTKLFYIQILFWAAIKELKTGLSNGGM